MVIAKKIGQIIQFFCLLISLLIFPGCYKKQKIQVIPQVVTTVNSTYNSCLCDLDLLPQKPEVPTLNPLLIQIDNESYVCYRFDDAKKLDQFLINLVFYTLNLEDYLSHICTNYYNNFTKKNLRIENRKKVDGKK